MSRLRRRRPEGAGPPPSTKPRGSRTAAVLRTVGRGAVRLTKGAGPDVAVVLLAGVALAIAWSTMSLTHDVVAGWMPFLAMMSVTPLVLLRRLPFVAWAVSAGGCVIWLFVPRLESWAMPWPVMHFLVLLLSLFVVALFARFVHVGWATVLTSALLLLVMPAELKPWALGVVVIAAFGLLLRWLFLSRRQLARQEEETEVEKARRAVLEERGRIARELHDVVAHHMSMIVVQAQSAPYRVDEVSPAARAEFSSIEDSARQALSEVRGLLGVLRDERAETATAPQPGLADVPSVLEQAAVAGMDLDQRVELDPSRCSAGTGLVLHRILGEALANASRHAPGARVEVALTEDDGQADLLVRNGPGGTPPSPGTGGGNGIPGMRTRAEAVGGHLHAGHSSGGGFVVHAVVPLTGHTGESA